MRPTKGHNVNTFSSIAIAAILALGAGAAHAGIALSNNGINFLGVTDNGSMASDQGIQGRGVSGEINIGETLTMNLAGSYTIESLQLGLLYDGPEFKDVNEVAQVTFFNGLTNVGAYTLTATNLTTAIWSGAGATVTNLSPATQPAGSGHWKVSGLNVANVTSIAFTALTGSCGSAGGGCSNQSDYIVTNVSAVPEPGTVGLLLAGLGAMGFVSKGRKRKV